MGGAEEVCEKQKQKLFDVLNKDYVSSEDEGEDDDGRKVFVVRKLAWRSDKLNNWMVKLDQMYNEKHLHKRGKDQTIKRVSGPDSSRTEPEKCPKFAKKHTA